MKKLKPILLVCVILTTLNIQAQDEGQNVTIPPSPNAAHLGTYGEMEVSKATGQANVSIPITSISEGGINIPITLSYQSAGLRVNERPSWVGMGWVLSGGGVISRTMRGRCDDLNDGFLENSTSIPNATIVQTDLNQNSFREGVYGRLESMELNNIDYVPDAFSFNLGGQGGGFFMGNDDNVHFVEHNTIRLEPIYGVEPLVATFEVIIGWKAIDQNGLVYLFNDYETTLMITRDNLNQRYISAWYLSSIYNPITDTKANFSYENTNYNYYYNDVAKSFHYQKLSGNTYYTGGSFSNSTQQVTHESVKFLSGVTLNNQSLTYSTTASSESFRKLDDIVWTNGTETKNFTFGYSYFPSESGCTVDCNRLKLNSVKELPTLSSEQKTHSFEYYTGDMPSKKDFGQDHWGYFNSAGNSSLVPNVTIGSQSLGEAANREPDFNAMQIGMLKKVTYPTKGSTEFFYEQNTWSDLTTYDDVKLVTDYGTMDVTASSAGVVCLPTTAVPLLKGGDGAVEAFKDYRLVYQCRLVTNTNYGPDKPTLTITESQTSTVIRSHFISLPVANFTIEANELTPGNTYIFEICATGENNEIQRAVVDIELEEVDPADIGQPAARLTGGLRLAKLENEDNVSTEVETKTYDYGTGGYLVWRDPIYYRIQTNAAGLSNLTISGSPTGGLGPSSMPVAYQKVNEWLGTPSLNTGRIETNFLPAIDALSTMKPQESQHYLRTKVDIENYYDSLGNLLKSENFDYHGEIVGRVTGFMAKKIKTTDPKDYLNDYAYANFILSSTWFQLVSKTTTDYTTAGTITNTVINKYGSNLHTNPTRVTRVNSTGDSLHTDYTYSIDEAIATNTCYADYLAELSANINILDEHVIESNTCKAKWTSCRADWYQCRLDQRADEGNCLVSSSVSCGVRKGKKWDCNNKFEQCLDVNGYFSCLGNLSYEYIEREREAYVNYMVCQSDFEDDLLDEYDNALLIQDRQKAAIALLNISNKRSVPLETKTLNEAVELTNAKLEYDFWEVARTGTMDTIPSLKSTSVSYQAGNPIPLLAFNKYDDRGNPLEVLDEKTGIVTSYIWGYNSTKLVAQVINASYADVSTALGVTLNSLYANQTASSIEAIVNNLRIHFSMSEAQVTTFTHKPGIGLSSIVDPNGRKSTYIYDELGRLKAVKDHDGNVLQKNEYFYGNFGF